MPPRSSTRHHLVPSPALAWVLLLAPAACHHTRVNTSGELAQVAAGTDDHADAATAAIDGAPTIEQATSGMQRSEGLIPMFIDAKSGRILLELGHEPAELLYVQSLAHGVGSNDLGLDRGQLGNTRIVHFEWVGDKVLLVHDNWDYRANGGMANSVRESFARSVLWGFGVVASEHDRVLVDVSEFLTSDAHDIADSLASRPEQPSRGGGHYSIDPTRSAIALDATANFVDNTELEATTTYVGQARGRIGDEISDVVPTPSAITVRQHHSFIRLPDANFQPRPHDPRTGYWSRSYLDFSTDFDESLVRRLQPRHRLQLDEQGRVVKPIVYYVDHAAPPEIRDALIEGARWWSKAFDAAGFPGGFRVEILPLDVHPLDVRYNVIQWAHRATRGWSYGSSVVDPRTGEIIKGHVTLGSQRIRQDFLIAEGLTGPYSDGGDAQAHQRAREFALARIRQLSAHEVGHTLGLSHNFAASATPYHSVMDYPTFVVDGDATPAIDISHAYEEGIGRWDELVIKLGYSLFSDPKTRDNQIDAWLHEAARGGAQYASDRHVHPASAHPSAHRWDAGDDPIAELERIVRMRTRVLAELATGRVAGHEPDAALVSRLVPMYFMHRYQVEATVKSIAGVHFDYALARDAAANLRAVDPDDQARALKALLSTLEPSFLRLPESVLLRLRPAPPEYGSQREDPRSRAAELFDPIAAAEAAAGLTLDLLLAPARATRLIEQSSRDPRQLGLEQLLEQLQTATSASPRERDPLSGEIRRAVHAVFVHRLLALAQSGDASEGARARAHTAVLELESRMKSRTGDRAWLSHRALVLKRIADYHRDPGLLPPADTLPMPPGAPIGQFACEEPNWTVFEPR